VSCASAVPHQLSADIVFFHSIAFSPLLISYTIEILPFPVRAKGHTMMSLTVSIAIIFNQYVNPIALDAIAWKYYVRVFP
jgi:methionyl-tRNA synthetase